MPGAPAVSMLATQKTESIGLQGKISRPVCGSSNKAQAVEGKCYDADRSDTGQMAMFAQVRTEERTSGVL